MRSGSLMFRLGWLAAMVAVTVLALLPIDQLQLPVFNWWDKAQHAAAFVVLTAWALLLWPTATGRVMVGMVAYGAVLGIATPSHSHSPFEIGMDLTPYVFKSIICS